MDSWDHSYTVTLPHDLIWITLLKDMHTRSCIVNVHNKTTFFWIFLSGFRSTVINWTLVCLRNGTQRMRVYGDIWIICKAQLSFMYLWLHTLSRPLAWPMIAMAMLIFQKASAHMHINCNDNCPSIGRDINKHASAVALWLVWHDAIYVEIFSHNNNYIIICMHKLISITWVLYLF